MRIIKYLTGIIGMLAAITTHAQTDTAYMQQHQKQLKEIVVTDRKKLVERKIDRIILNVAGSPLASTGTVLDALSTAPGVMVDNDRIYIKGRTGTMVMMDGRPLYLSAAEISRMLKNMPAGTIDKIEIITNPSAKYDAAGNAGIINIRTKKSRIKGMNGSLGLTYATGFYPKYNTNADINYRNNKIYLFAGLSDNYNKNRAIFKSHKTITGKDPLTFDEAGLSVTNGREEGIRAGMEYYMNPNNTFALSTNTTLLHAPTAETYNTHFSSNGSSIDSSLYVRNGLSSRYHNITGNINYKHTFDSLGSELAVNADYAAFRSRNKGSFVNSYVDVEEKPSRPDEQLRSNSPVTIDIFTATADYTKILPHDWKLEAGVKTSSVRTDNDILFENKQGTDWYTDAGKTNHFRYKENISAFYFNFYKKTKFAELQWGLRGEQTSYNGYSLTTGTEVRNSYFQLFPSVFITKELGEDHVLNLSYSRRIDRPSYQDLNPFIYYNSPYAYYQGNPYVLPQYTHSLEASWTFKEDYTLTLGYAAIKDYFTYISYLDSSTNITKETIANFNTARNISLDVSATQEITDWWTCIVNLSAWSDRYTALFNNAPINNNILSFSGNVKNTFIVNKRLTLEATGIYRSPTIDVIQRSFARYRVDLGCKYTLIENKLILKTAVKDLFYTYRSNGVNKVGNLDERFYNTNETRLFIVALTWNFGKLKKMDKHSGNKSNEAELDRIRK